MSRFFKPSVEELERIESPVGLTDPLSLGLIDLLNFQDPARQASAVQGVGIHNSLDVVPSQTAERLQLPVESEVSGCHSESLTIQSYCVFD
jgi:hypothetical protein